MRSSAFHMLSQNNAMSDEYKAGDVLIITWPHGERWMWTYLRKRKRYYANTSYYNVTLYRQLYDVHGSMYCQGTWTTSLTTLDLHRHNGRKDVKVEFISVGDDVR
jgi:hypothetical protein